MKKTITILMAVASLTMTAMAQQDARNTTIWTTPDGVTRIHVPDAFERMTGMTHEQFDKEMAEAQLENEAIAAMNGGHLPSNWPTNPPADGQMTWDEVKALQAEAGRRLNAIRAANGGQLPSDWRELIVQDSRKILAAEKERQAAGESDYSIHTAHRADRASRHLKSKTP